MIDFFAIGWFVASAMSLWYGLHAKHPAWRAFSTTIFIFFAVAMFNHWLPGIHNFLVYEKVLISEDAIPSSLYLNVDKTWIGLVIYLFILRQKESLKISRDEVVFAAKVLAGLVAVMLPLALLTQYVHWDPKFPPETWVWAANNLFLVCTAEECFFRGYVQNAFAKKGKWPAILIAAGFFGLQHWQGGPIYVIFAAIAGVAYGLVYWRTQKIVFPIIVHFLFNTMHFSLFTYPALSR